MSVAVEFLQLINKTVKGRSGLPLLLPILTSKMSSLLNITNATAPLSRCSEHPEGLIVWSCAVVVSTVFAIPGTFVVLLDIFQKGRKGTSLTPNDVFMANLCLLDALICVFFTPYFAFLTNNVDFRFEQFIYFISSLNVCGRPLFITCISLDCYLAVVHPVTYRVRKSLTPRILMAAGVWIVTLVFGILFVVKPKARMTEFVPLSFFAFTLPVVGFCDFCVLWTLKRSKLGGKEIHPQKKKAANIIFNHILITFLSYLPPSIAVMMGFFSSLDKNILYCLVLFPAITITLIGNTVSLILHLISLGKLDWLKNVPAP